VAQGHSIILEFATQPGSGALGAFAHAPGSATHLFDFHVDADATNTQPSGVKAGSVRTAVLSAVGVPALPAGSAITLTFPASDSQTASAAEFAGVSAADPLDRVASAGGNTPAVSSRAAAPTGQASDLPIGAVGGRGGVDSRAPDDPTHDLGFTAGAGYLVLPGNGTASGSQGNKNVSIHPEYEVVSAVREYQADGSLRGT